MPTCDRRRFAARAIEYFRRQDHRRSELLILDDGGDPIEDLVPRDRRIRYVRLERRMILGAKRNHGCELARGEIVLHWDDDDWQAPDRISAQLTELRRRDAELVGVDRELFVDPRARRAWIYSRPPGPRPWLAGTSLAYRKDFWERNRFPEVAVGEDTRFVWAAAGARLASLDDYRLVVGIIHAGNANPKRTASAGWSPCPFAEVEQLLGEDAAFYAGL
jgi:glycosyltransferase involved in cell wall biosynthesis